MKKLILHGFIGLIFLILTAVFSTPVFALLGIAESENASGLDCDEVFRKEIRSKEGSDAEKNQSYTVDKAILSKKDNDYCLFRLISINPGFEGKFENTLKISYVENANNMASKVSELKSQEGGSQVQSFSDDGLDYSVSSKDLAKTVLVLKHCIIEHAFIDHSGTYDAEQMADMARSGGLALQMGSLSTVSSFCGGAASADQSGAKNVIDTPKTGQQAKQSNSNKNGNPFNIFAINPFEAWLKLKAVSDIPQLFEDAYVDIFYEHALWGPGALEQLTIEDIYGGTLGSQFPSDLEPAINVKDEKEAWAFLPNYVFPDKENITVVKGQGQIKPANSNQFVAVSNSSGDVPSFTTYVDSIFTGATSEMVTFRYTWGSESGAVINISPKTEVKIVKPIQDKKTQDLKRVVKLNKGELEVKVKNANPKNKFGVQTDFVDLIVIGTHFWVKNDPDHKLTLVGVYEGEVEVTTKSGQKTLVSPNGGKPGVVIVAQKLSVLKLILVGTVLVVIIGGVILFLKRRGNKVSAQRK